jgi:multidrug efflux system membrane fusion protein
MFSPSVPPTAWLYGENQQNFTVQPPAKLIEESAGAREVIHHSQMPALPDTDDSDSDLRTRLQRRRWLWIGAIALVLIIGGLWLWHRHEAAVAAAAAAKRAAVGVTITTATARKGDIGIYLEAIGTVTPVYTASIASQVNGVVTGLLFKEGQQVRKGDALIDIDPRPYQATLLQAQGALERDQNVLAQAQMDLERYRNALAKNAVASQTVDDQEKLVLQDQGTVKNDQGSVQYDQVQLEYCHIIAPISGQVGLRLVDPGNVVQSSGAATLAVITQMQPITVIFTLSEDSLGPVLARLRQQAQLSVDVFDRSAQKKIASGELLALDNQIDTTTGTVKVRAQFDNKDNALYPNQFVNTRLLVNTLQGVTLIPAAAVQQNGSASFVYVIQNNIAALRTIKTGVTDGGVTQVDGIQPGDVVATSGFDKLQDKAKVAITTTPPAPATTSGTQAP